MFFELPWVGGAQEDAMAVAISVKYLVWQNCQITFYCRR